jgi:hypothetical protein
MADHRVIDARRFDEPRPLAGVLEAVARLRPGDTLKLLIDGEPGYLYPILDRAGLAHRTEPGDDHDNEVLIWPGDA